MIKPTVIPLHGPGQRHSWKLRSLRLFLAVVLAAGLACAPAPIFEAEAAPQRLVADIEAARAAAARHGALATAAVYQRRGYVTGAETLTSELLASVGFGNVGGDLAGRIGAFVPLESLVAARPDYLVVASPRIRAEDQGTALLRHPALRQLYPPDRRIILPERLTVCAGPSLPAAHDWLADEVERLTGGS